MPNVFESGARARLVRVGLAALPLLCLAVLSAAYYAKGIFVRGDAFQAYSMFNYALGNMQAAGEFPQWLPFAAYGSPAEAYDMTFLGPFHILLVLAGGALKLADAWSLFVVATFLESAVFVLGAQLFARELTDDGLAAAGAGVWVAVSVYWNAQIFWPHRVLLYVPLMLLFALRLHRTGDLRNLVRAALAALLGLVGGIAYVGPLYALCGVVFLGLLRLLDRDGGCRGIVRPGLPLAAELGLLLVLGGLYAALMATAFDGAAFVAPDRDPVTGAASLETFLNYGGEPLRKLPEFVLGHWYWHQEYLFYLGAGALGLVVLALRRERGGPFLALCGLALLLFLLALGPHGLVGYAAYWFPGMDRFRHLSFLLPMVRLLLVFLAAAGLARLLALPREEQGRAMAWVTIGALALLAGKHLVNDEQLHYVAPGLADLVPELGVVLLLGARCCGWLWRSRPRALGAAVALAVACELWAANYAMLGSARAFLEPEEIHAVGDGIDLARVQPHRFLPGRAAELTDNPRALALVNVSLRQPVNNFALLQLVGADPCTPLFRIDYLMPEVGGLLERAAPGALLKANQQYDPGRILKGLLWRPALDEPWFREACGCDGNKLALETPDGGRRDVSAGVRHFSANILELRLDAGPEGGTLYYADAFHPRWRATVDGAAVPVERAREAFKALAVPPGEHELRFTFFTPWREWARRGLGALGLAALALLLAAAIGGPGRGEGERRA